VLTPVWDIFLDKLSGVEVNRTAPLGWRRAVPGDAIFKLGTLCRVISSDMDKYFFGTEIAFFFSADIFAPLI